MNSQINAETLSPVIHNSVSVITTDLLAQLYVADIKQIQNNYLRNSERFTIGKHYFKLEGDELKAFKNKPSLRGLVASRAKHLILWTERGAARHAKMLETDQAWEVFEKLEDCYFNQKNKPQMPVTENNSSEPRYRVRVIIHDDLFGGCVEMIGKGESFRAIANGIATDLGYKPQAFTYVAANKEKMKRIY